MRASVFVLFMIVVFGLSYTPVAIATMEPFKSALAAMNFTIYEDTFIKIEFSMLSLVNLLPIPLSLIGLFLGVCIYKSQSCAWRNEHVRDKKYLPLFYDN